MRTYFRILSMAALSLLMFGFCLAHAEDGVDVSTGVDLVSRYVWRGADVGNAPSAQPSLAAQYSGFELGVWAAYSLSNQVAETDEIDFWLSYSHEFPNSVALTLIATDYYYPNAGVRMFNFDNYDAADGPGAHTVEAGVQITGPASFPLTAAGYVNVYNDAGNNTYFQLDFPVEAPSVSLNFFMGATGGSKDNPDYYGSDNFAVINIGVQATREVKVSESFSFPLSVSYIVNPRKEISYLVFGVSF